MLFRCCHGVNQISPKKALRHGAVLDGDFKIHQKTKKVSRVQVQ